MWQEVKGRAQVLIPMDFKRRVRDLAAVHSED
jgi:site-specific DNA recombinase